MRGGASEFHDIVPGPSSRILGRAAGCAAVTLESEPHLQLDAAIVAVLGKCSEATRQRVGAAEDRRRDVADDLAGVVVVEQVARRNRERQVVAPVGGSAAHSAHATAAHAHSTARPARTVTAASGTAMIAARTAAAAEVAPRVARAFARRPESEGLGEPEIHGVLRWTPAEIARQNLLAGRWIRIQQTVACCHDARLVRIGRNAGTPGE